MLTALGIILLTSVTTIFISLVILFIKENFFNSHFQCNSFDKTMAIVICSIFLAGWATLSYFIYTYLICGQN